MRDKPTAFVVSVETLICVRVRVRQNILRCVQRAATRREDIVG